MCRLAGTCVGASRKRCSQHTRRGATVGVDERVVGKEGGGIMDRIHRIITSSLY